MTVPPLAVLAKLGDAADALVNAVRAVPGRVRSALTDGRSRRLGLGAAASTIVLYLVAIGDIGIALDARYARFAAIPSIQVAPDWPEKLLSTRAPFVFEATAAVYVLPQLALFISLGNALLAAIVAVLVAANVAVAVHAVAAGRACRRSVFGRVLGVLPAFLTGMTCCVPAVLLLLGTGIAAALVPVFVPFRAYLFPLALALMLTSLIWSGRRGHPGG